MIPVQPARRRLCAFAVKQTSEPPAPLSPTPKPWITAIQAYTPGQSRSGDGKELIKLSANENPLGTSASALAAQAKPPARYPDPDATLLRRAIGQMHKIDPARIVCGTGSDELLNLAAQAYAGAGDEVIYVRYGFSVYDIAARRCAATPIIAPDADYGTDVDALLACITPRTRVVFLANPNNPTGTFLTAGEIARLHAALPPDVLFVLDQAYAEYLAPQDDDGGMVLAATHDNVLITRTFSKIYGLAGERIGWATGAPGLIDSLNRIRGPFNVSATGQAMALAALADQGFVARSREHNAKELARFTDAISEMSAYGLRAIPSKANFLLILFEGKLSAEAAHNGLMARGYATRWLPGQGLAQGLRITIGTPEQMDDITKALHEMARQAEGPA